MAKKTYLVIKAKTRREVELRKKKEENLQVYQKKKLKKFKIAVL